MKRILLSILASLALSVIHSDALSIRFVTWNVLSNSWMDNGFDNSAIQELLGPITEDGRVFHQHDIYVVSVQENCYMCNSNNAKKLANVFLNVLQEFETNYHYKSISMTRNNRLCESINCLKFPKKDESISHGTTAIMLFAREDLLESFFINENFHVNECDFKLYHNAEKGIAGIRTLDRSNNKTLCFAGLHLDFKRRKAREKCIAQFFDLTKQRETTHDHRKCDIVIMGGDFNSRPGNKILESSRSNFDDDYFKELKPKDELTGEDTTDGPLIDYINNVSGHNFEDGELTFKPTYSILRSSIECPAPCYKKSRTPSWTDRIICSGCKKREYYNSMWLGMSDHDPVIAIFQT